MSTGSDAAARERDHSGVSTLEACLSRFSLAKAWRRGFGGDRGRQVLGLRGGWGEDRRVRRSKAGGAGIRVVRGIGQG